MFLFDSVVLSKIDNPNMLVPWYLLSSYAYYVLDRPVISDSLFDKICRRLDLEWDQIAHMHKHWIDRDDLSAGTRMSTDYPSMAKASACEKAGVAYQPPQGLQRAVLSCEKAVDALLRRL